MLSNSNVSNLTYRVGQGLTEALESRTCHDELHNYAILLCEGVAYNTICMDLFCTHVRHRPTQHNMLRGLWECLCNLTQDWN